MRYYVGHFTAPILSKILNGQGKVCGLRTYLKKGKKCVHCGEVVGLQIPQNTLNARKGTVAYE
jgi:hypothetical protein